MADAKHPSVRNRRNKTQGLRQLAAVPGATAPAWPLAGDAVLVAQVEALRDAVARGQAAAAAETDRRKRYRLARALERDQLALSVAEIQAEQAGDAEAAIWAELWKAPQAAIWAENSATTREVALYCRWMVKAEQGDTKAAGEARALSNVLGINPAALLRLRAEIENVDAVEDRGRRRRERTAPDKPATDGKADPRSGLFAV